MPHPAPPLRLTWEKAACGAQVPLRVPTFVV